MTKNTATGPGGPGVDLGQMTKMNQQSLETVAHLHSRMIRDSLRFQAELLDFARRRVGAGVQTQDRLSRCRSVNEAVEVVSAFCQDAVRDYSEEATGIVRLCVDIATTSAEETVSEANGKTDAARP